MRRSSRGKGVRFPALIIATLLVWVAYLWVNISYYSIDTSVQKVATEITTPEGASPLRFILEDDKPIGLIMLDAESLVNYAEPKESETATIETVAPFLTGEQMRATLCLSDMFNQEPEFRVEVRINPTLSFTDLKNWYTIDESTCKVRPLRSDDEVTNVINLTQVPSGYEE